MEHRLRGALIVFVLLIVQTTFMPFLSVGGFLPDLLLIWLVITALRRGQGEATVAGFLVGLAEDLLATQLFGLAALSKTVAGFFAGYFYNENKTDQTLGSYQFMMIVGLSSLVHNFIFYTVFLQGSDVPLIQTVIYYSAATTLYTGILSALPMFAFSRRVPA
ncbi:MAG: rod shape-determining protein MreD [Ignavibacteriales bacterium]|nr:rod shape-determining protein MreD [Ignavibacteriales bacterium]